MDPKVIIERKAKAMLNLVHFFIDDENPEIRKLAIRLQFPASKHQAEMNLVELLELLANLLDKVPNFGEKRAKTTDASSVCSPPTVAARKPK